MSQAIGCQLVALAITSSHLISQTERVRDEKVAIAEISKVATFDLDLMPISPGEIISPVRQT